MTLTDGYRLVSTDPSRSDDVMHVTQFAFAFTVPEREREHFAQIYPWDSGRAVEVADASRGTVGALAAAHASFRFRIAVPGGRSVATSGLSWVSVHPGHRRRGLLTAMIDDHFSRSLERGEAISALYASEAQIYQRFGYGLAARTALIELARGTKLRDVAGAADLMVDIDSASHARHAAVVASVQARMTRPGTIVEFGDITAAEAFLDLESDREGAEELRIVIIRDGDDPLAFALLSRKGVWEVHAPDGKVTVRAWGSVEPRATARLMQVLTDFDLMSKTAIGRVALDDETLHLLQDPRAARAGIEDNLWVRLLDLPAALAARGYAADADVTVAITDPQLPDNAGTWRITIVDGAATVTRTEALADLAMSIQELGAVYLGGTSIATLARAGLITEHRAGAARALSTAFLSDLAPACNIGF